MMKKWFYRYGIGILVALGMAMVLAGGIKLSTVLIPIPEKKAEHVINTIITDELREPDEPNLAKRFDILAERLRTFSKFMDISAKKHESEIASCIDRLDKYNKIIKNLAKSNVLPEPNIPQEPNFTDIIQSSIKSVVHIMCPQWQGSGFIIDEHLIMTARHIVEGVEDFEITLYDRITVRATRAISSKNHDIALIWVEEKLPNPVELGSIKDCILGQDIYAIGSPYGKMNFNSLTKGIVSGLDRDMDFTDYMTGDKYGWSVSFTTDTAGHPGNSGCPVFTMDGKVRGVLVGGFSPVLIIVMPVDIILDDLEEIELMFIQDEYELEKKPVGYNSYYNYSTDTEYYEN